jgi:hypothetical protein
MSYDARESVEEIPNHMIVWVDQSIGTREDYNRLKAAFSSTADPNYFNPIRLIDKDDEAIDRTTRFEQVRFEGVEFLLAPFTNIEKCIVFLQENQGKRIFFITSGQMGRAAVPLIMKKCKHIFTDPVTDEPHTSIYVFCHSIEKNADWILEYPEYILPFTFDADLLVRMIRDIADYFVVESKRLLEVNPPNYSAAYSRLNWAHTLYDRYRTMEKVSLKTEFDEVNELLRQAEEGMSSSSSDDES